MLFINELTITQICLLFASFICKYRSTSQARPLPVVYPTPFLTLPASDVSLTSFLAGSISFSEVFFSSSF
jgi:hypothetical protein